MKLGTWPAILLQLFERAGILQFMSLVNHWGVDIGAIRDHHTYPSS